MSVALNSLSLILLFAGLGFAADLAVRNIKYIAVTLKMKLFALGILLGIITTLPELSVGTNALVEGVAGLSVGNILGGVVVIIGLILGTALILGNKIDTKDNLKSSIPAFVVILSPLLLGLDGKYAIGDGLLMIALYIGLLFYLYKINHSFNYKQTVLIEKPKIAKAVFLSIVGVIAVMLTSHWIVGITVDLLENINVSKLFIGLVVFSIGTNLPEITITLTSWRRKTLDFSLSHLVSSAFTNILVLGLLSVTHPIVFILGSAYYSLAIFLVLISVLFLYFCHSRRNLDRQEGFVLLAVYILFIATNIFLAVR